MYTNQPYISNPAGTPAASPTIRPVDAPCATSCAGTAASEPPSSPPVATTAVATLPCCRRRRDRGGAPRLRPVLREALGLLVKTARVDAKVLAH